MKRPTEEQAQRALAIMRANAKRHAAFFKRQAEQKKLEAEKRQKDERSDG